MMNALMVTKPFLASLDRYVEERQIAVTKAINKCAIEYSNAVKTAMRTTTRMPPVTKIVIHAEQPQTPEPAAPKVPKPRKPRGKRVKKTLFSRLSNLAAKVSKKASKKIKKIKFLKKKAKRAPRPPKPKADKVHRPSIPGMPPAPDTGLLINSVRIDRSQKKEGGFEASATISTETKYARALEYELNRPVWRPVWADQFESIRKRIADAQNGKK